MVSSNRIQRGDPQLKEVLLGFLDSASSLCDIMNTTMAAILNEIMSIQANEACGTEGATRCGYRERGRDALADGAQAVQRLVLPDRPLQALHRAPSALAEMYVTATSTRKVEKVDSLSKGQVLRLCAVVEGKVDALLARGCSPLRFA